MGRDILVQFMEIFSEYNRFYRESSAFPTIPPPIIEEKTFNRSSNDQLQKRPSFRMLKNIYALIHQKSQQAIIFQIPEQVKQNPFLSQFNSKSYFENLAKLENLTSHFSLLLHQSKYPPIFDDQFSQILTQLESQFAMDITSQRGKNPFIFVKDYSKQQIHVVGIFENRRNCEIIAENISLLNLPDFVNVHPVFSIGDFEQEAFYEQYQSIDLSKIDLKHTMKKNASKDNLNQYVFNMREYIEECQIYYAEFRDKALFLPSILIALALLQNGGTLILKTTDISDPIINQYLYILSKVFSTFILYTSSHESLLFEVSIYIGCYGFRKKGAQNVYNEILSSYDILQNSSYFIINSFKIYQDQIFEKEIVSFLKDLFSFRSQQILLWKYFEEQKNLIPIQVNNQINILREEEKSQKKSNFNQNRWQKNNSNNSNYQRYQSQPKPRNEQKNQLMNKSSFVEIQSSYDDYKFSIKTKAKQERKQLPPKITEKELEEKRLKEEEELLLKLTTNNPKTSQRKKK